MEPDHSTPSFEGHYLPSWICGAERHAFDGAVRLRTEGAASKFILRDAAVYRCQSILFPESDTLFGPRPQRYSLRHAVERVDGLQLVASRTAETHEQRFAVSSLLHVLQVHVGQHWLLWSLGKCSQRVGILAECLRFQVGMGAMLLRCHPRPYRICHL